MPASAATERPAVSAQSVLGRPLDLGRVRLPNRIVSAPMERNYCTPEGFMTELYRDYLLRRAREGVGLVFTEATFVRADGRGRTHQLGMHRDECVPGVRALADALHAQGSLLGMELNHGGRTVQATVSGFPAVAPSPIPCEVSGGEMPRELTIREIEELARAFGEAAARCVAAGTDVIEIHGGHGYLIHQFMSPLYNRRADRFGDPGEFLALVIDRVREAAPELTIGLRVSAVEGAEGGLTAEQQFDIIAETRLDLLDYLDISAGNYEAGEWIIQSGEWSPGFLAPYARRYRELGLPLGMAGRLNTPEAAARAITDGVTDFVTIGRALHADPTWARAALSGGSYRPCIACNVCIDGLGDGAVTCSVNPEVGRGRVFLPAPTVGKTGGDAPRVVVVGAGPAGLSAAVLLSENGADVTVLEERDRLGGQLELASRQQPNPEFGRYLRWASECLAARGVDVRLNTRAGGALVSSLSPDAVVLATGGAGNTPAIPGIDGERVHDLRDWLARHESDDLPGAVTIWGNDGPAMSVADTLASRGVRVLMVGAQPRIAPEFGRRGKILVLPRLAANPDVRMIFGATIDEIGDDRVLVHDGAERTWIDAPGIVLVSQGVHARPLDRDAYGDAHTFVAGDAAGRPGSSVRASIVSGTDTARRILDLYAGETKAVAS